MAQMLLATIGAGQSLKDRLLLGWFGPRGLASIVFAIIVLDAGMPDGETLNLCAAYTIILSVIAHGLSAGPLARTYCR